MATIWLAGVGVAVPVVVASLVIWATAVPKANTVSGVGVAVTI